MTAIKKDGIQGKEILETPDQHSRRLKPFTYPTAIRNSEKKIIDNVRNFGFHIVAVKETDDTPEFFYTIGLYSQYQHPELLIMGVHVSAAADIFRRAHTIIKNGGAIQPWISLPEEMTHTPMKSVAIDASNYTAFLGYGMWFYRSLGKSRPDTFPAIQFVWPDVPNDIYPWDEGYDTGFSFVQNVLCNDQSLNQAVERNAWGANNFGASLNSL